MQDLFTKLARKAARLLPLAALALTSFSAAHAATLAVPAGYPTIQAAVNASQSGDTVLIADGTYTGDGNRDIDFGGKSLTVMSQNGPSRTIMDCGGHATAGGFSDLSGRHRGFSLRSGVPNAVISGLTIQNGYEIIDNGGAIYNGGGMMTVTNCTFTSNTASQQIGGAIYNGGGTMTVTGCTFSGNNAAYGGGLYNSGSMTVTNCTFTGNTGSYGGGGLYNNGVATMTNCTLTGNMGGEGGGGGGTYTSGGVTTLTNCILYGDIGARGSGETAGGATATYCDIQGVPGTPTNPTANHDFSADPLFVNAANGDYHLQTGSPCLGAGTGAGASATDADGKLRPNPPSIGAFEGTAATQAITSHLLWTNPDGRTVLWNVNAAGQFFIVGAYGPYNDGSPNTPWTATALSTSPDGLSHILWTNPDGHVILWNVAADGTFIVVANYGPYTDAPGQPGSHWKAVALSYGPDNTGHVLWANPDGRVVLWNVAADGSYTFPGAYGPYDDGSPNTPWSAVALATGPDGLSHILWTNPDGHVILWNVAADGSFTITGNYGPYTDGSPSTPWTATALSVGGDNVPHILWTNPDGHVILWNVASNGSFTVVANYGPSTDGSPNAPWKAVALATGLDGLSHLLWNNPDGRTMLWTVDTAGSVTPFFYGPYTDGSPSTPWTAAAVSANP